MNIEEALLMKLEFDNVEFDEDFINPESERHLNFTQTILNRVNETIADGKLISWNAASDIHDFRLRYNLKIDIVDNRPLLILIFAAKSKKTCQK